METGTSDGNASLIIPSIHLAQAKIELHHYWERQNPSLLNAERFYSESVLADPDIPLKIFTKNIDTILAKKIGKHPSPSTAASILSPASSLTGQTSKTSKSSTVAWQIPLQHNTVSALIPSGGVGDTSLPRHSKADALSPREIAQEKRIQLLEEQLASLSAGNSRTSGEKSQCSGDSPNSLATAHARLDGIEHTVMNIHSLLQTMADDHVHRSSVPPPVNHHATEWPQMPRKQLFSESTSTPGDSRPLALLENSTLSPVKQKAQKRHKATDSPSHLSSHNKDLMDSGGVDENSC
jgi:hypothetical protein